MSGVIKINPSVYADRRDAAAVAWNEALRLFMEDEGFTPEFDVTPEQMEFFKGTAYAGGDEGTDQSAERGGNVLGPPDPVSWGLPPEGPAMRAETGAETRRRTYVEPASMRARDRAPTTDEIIGVRASGNAVVDTVNRAVGAAVTFGPAGAAALGGAPAGGWRDVVETAGASVARSREPARVTVGKTMTAREILAPEYAAGGADLEAQVMKAVAYRKANRGVRFTQTLGLLDLPSQVDAKAPRKALGGARGDYATASREARLGPDAGPSTLRHEVAGHGTQSPRPADMVPIAKGASRIARVNEYTAYMTTPFEIDVRLPAVRLAAGSDSPAKALLKAGFTRPDRAGARPGKSAGPAADALPEDARELRDVYNSLHPDEKRKLWDHMIKVMPGTVSAGGARNASAV